MTCDHCEKVIKLELTKFNPDVNVQVNMQEKTVQVQNLADDRVVFLLKEIGYTPKKVG